jgi:glycosyltransferase involved in cell wall biosynthesis
VRARGARAALRLADIALAATVAAGGAAVLLARAPRRRRAPRPERPRLLAIDSIFTLDVLRARGAEHFVTHRDLDGYFDRVWNVHPLVGAHPGSAPETAVGAPTVTVLSSAHTMIEGRVRRFATLQHLPYLDFACAQVQLILMLDRIVDREGVGIVRGDPYYHGLLAILLARLNGARVELRIVGDHDAIYEATGVTAYPRLFPSRAVEQRVARFTLSRADSVVAGPAHRAFALRNGARADRMTHLANANMVNPIHLAEPRERERVADEFGLGDRPVVMCVSRLERMKHPEDVLISVAKARRRDPRIAAVIVGDGAMRDELGRLATELGVERDVSFAGERDQRWIAGMLAQSTVVAAPIAGLSLLESALSGTPIVAYDNDWHAELLRSPREGLLVPYRDTDAMADAICALTADPERAARVAAAARAHALEIMQPAKLIADERALAARLLADAVPFLS